jgi:hypothetical protein
LSEENGSKYENDLRALQIELVKLQRRLIAESARVLVIIEGRDGAGKDGTIKRLTQHMSPRETRVFAPSKPSDRENAQWYFQRFVPHLPAGGEFVIFNRSWYNRAGVERVMGFAARRIRECFFDTVNDFRSASGAFRNARPQILSRHFPCRAEEAVEGREAIRCRPGRIHQSTHRRSRNGTSTPALATRCSGVHTISSRLGILCAPITRSGHGSL